MTTEIFSFIGLAGLLFGFAFVPYIIGICWKGKQPKKASWLLWFILDAIILYGMYYGEGANGQIVVATIGSGFVTCLAFWFGKPGWTPLEKWCLGGSVLGILLWKIFDSPETGIIISLILIFIASLPTYFSGLEDPERESKLAWLLFGTSGIVAVYAIKAPVSDWTIMNAAQPVGFFLCNSIMMVIIFLLGARGRASVLGTLATFKNKISALKKRLAFAS